MTNQEAIEVIEYINQIEFGNQSQALNMAIWALTNPEKKLEKIRAEIEDLEPEYDCDTYYGCLNDVLAIIDKYIGEVR